MALVYGVLIYRRPNENIAKTGGKIFTTGN